MISLFFPAVFIFVGAISAAPLRTLEKNDRLFVSIRALPELEKVFQGAQSSFSSSHLFSDRYPVLQLPALDPRTPRMVPTEISIATLKSPYADLGVQAAKMRIQQIGLGAMDLWLMPRYKIRQISRTQWKRTGGMRGVEFAIQEMRGNLPITWSHTIRFVRGMSRAILRLGPQK